MLDIQVHGSDVLVAVKVVPKASADKIVGELDGTIKIRIAAAPERGAANAAVCKLVAKALKLRASDVTVETGHASPRKTLRIRGAGAEAVRSLVS